MKCGAYPRRKFTLTVAASGLFGWIFESLGLKAVQTKPVDHDPIDGAVQWAGVGDTYFAMLAVPRNQ
jgi:hypothetical protein